MARENPDRGKPNKGPTMALIYSQSLFVVVGLFFGLALLKFGNPVIFEGKLPPPSNLSELVYFNWPVQWGWAIVMVVGVLLLPLCRLPSHFPRWLLIAPVLWSLWQWVAAADSIQPDLSRLTALHLTVVAACFYFGLLATRGVSNSMPIWLGSGIGLCLVISIGFQQQFGGLEETRIFYEKLARGEQTPELQAAFDRPGVREIWQSPLFQFKVNSRRIYSTLFYPNTLAGVLLLFVPGLVAAVWLAFGGASRITRSMLAGLILMGAGLCLIWSGSKAGWLIAVAQGGLLFLRSSIPAKWRRTIVITIAIVGVAGLVIRNLDYFQRGAKSVGARTDYWVSAGQAFVDNPVTGTGPGTFGEAYRVRKSADAEMAQLAHNDFIQQASDSGGVGFLSFLVFVGGGFWWLSRNLSFRDAPLARLIWIGLAGWILQCLVEFGLYIPAIAWPAFFLFGLLCREAANHVDTSPASR